MTTTFEEIASQLQAERDAEPNVNGVRVGDFFVSSWGYDQTNIDFYRVVGLTAKRIKVQAWKSASTINGRVVPGDGPRTADRCTLKGEDFYNADYWTRQAHMVTVEAPIRVKEVKDWSDRPCFVVASYANAYLWEGTQEYDTIAAGEPGH